MRDTPTASLPARRREVLSGVVAATVLCGLGTRRPVAALETGQSSYTETTVSVTSKDGTTIEATLYEPDGQGPYPAVLGTHGWGGNRTMVDMGKYASRGYVGLAYDSRGFGNSGGTVTLNGKKEQEDAQALISWLSDRESVLTDGPDNPRLGMEGGSYGGGIQPRVAANDDRVDAIVPEYTWYDLTSALAPNGVLKLGWALGLRVAASTGELSTEFEDRTARILERGTLTPADRQYFESRSTVSYDDGPDAPALFVQEFTDRLFPPTEGVRNFRWARDSGAEAALILGNGTAHAQLRQRDRPPAGVDTYNKFVGQAVVDWFDAHLKDNGDHGLAPVSYYDHSTDSFVEAAEFPPTQTTETVFSHSFDSPVELRGPDADPVTVDWGIERETDLAGTPSLSVPVRPTGDGDSHLFATLQHVSDGQATVLKDQVAPVAVDSEATVTFDLPCVQRSFLPGDTLRLALAPGSAQLTDADINLQEPELFCPTAAAAGVEVRSDGPLELTAPTSVTPPPVVGGTEPRDPAGDGLYRDVRGDNSVGLPDVQALFDNLDDPAVQEYASAFNFSGTDPTEVTVLDVQALFADL